MKKKNVRNDMIVLAVILALSCISGVFLRFYRYKTTKSAEAVVTIGETEYGRYPLKKDQTIYIESEKGAYNVLKIAGGKAEVTEASCPDKICVKHKPISLNGETIVCLPNKLVVEIESEQESGVDSTTH